VAGRPCYSSLIQHVAEVKPTEIDDPLRQAGVAKIPEGYPGVQDPLIYHIRDARVLGITYTSLKGSPVPSSPFGRDSFPKQTNFLTRVFAG